MAGLLIELLGGFRVLSAGGGEIAVSSRKARAVLAVIALAPGSAVSRDVLATLLWEDSDPELARASLRQALAALRRALPAGPDAALKCTANTVALDAALAESDVARFHALLRDGSPGALAVAAEQHAGVLLDGLDARSGAFDEWLAERRRELRRELTHALARLAAQCSTAGDDDGAVAALERLTAIEPSNERAQRELMGALVRQGRYTDALRQYRVCRDALRRDLDVAPEPATEQLRRDLLRRRRASSPGLHVARGVSAKPVTGSGPDAVNDESASPPDGPHVLREAVVLVARVADAPDSDDDPETVRALWAAADQRLGEVVERHGGRVDRPREGEAVAVFGLGTRTGYEVERALRAALELAAPRGATPATPHHATSATRPSEPPRLAVGVADGQVLPASDQQAFPVVGKPVATARALARAASPGRVLAAPTLATATDGRFRFEPIDAPAGLAALRVGAAGGTGAPAPGRRFAGRRAELAMLTTLLERVLATRRGRAVVVRGEPGIGKSSLLEALAAAASRLGATCHATQVLDFGQAATERPLPALVSRVLGVAPDAADAERRSAIERAVATAALPAEDALLAADLIGASPADVGTTVLATMDDAARERGRARVLHHLVERASGGAALLIIIEDVHWADPLEIAQLGDLAASAATLPVLLALSTRTDDDPISAAWRARARGCPVIALDLAPLADDEARELAAQYADLSAERVEECLEKAAGHPLFLEQLLRSAQSGQTSLPASVRGLLLGRVERLTPAQQRGLRAAAVLGSRFTLSALRHVLADPNYPAAALDDSGLVATDGDECRFTHALVRAAVYESLLRSTRHEFHRRSAAWFQGSDASLEADHLAAAEDPLAPAAYLRAARHEQHASRLDRALAQAQRARSLARGAADLCEACATLGDVYLTKGRTDDAITAFRESVDLAATSGERARAWLGLATALRVVDRHDEALAALAHAEQSAAAEADPRRMAQLWTLRGNLHFPRGELDACLGAHQRALEFAQQADSPEDIARARGGLGDAQYQRGRMRTAHAEYRRCVDACERHGLAGLRRAYLPMVATTHAYIGEFAESLAVCNEAMSAARRIGDLRSELLATSIHASLALYRADYDTALASSERSIALARDIGARRFEVENLVGHGLAELGLGRGDAARATLTRAIELARATSASYCGPWAAAAAACAAENSAQSRSLLEEGERWLADGCVSHNYLEFYRLAIDVSLRDGDDAAALRYAAALEAYTREEPLPWADAVIAACRGAVAGGEALRAARAAATAMQFNALTQRLP